MNLKTVWYFSKICDKFYDIVWALRSYGGSADQPSARYITMLHVRWLTWVVDSNSSVQFLSVFAAGHSRSQDCICVAVEVKPSLDTEYSFLLNNNYYGWNGRKEWHERGKMQRRELSAGTVKKKAKRDQKFRREWEKTFPWLKPSKQNSFTTLCNKCNVELGSQITPIILHEKSAKHKANCTASSSRIKTEVFSSVREQSSGVMSAEIRLSAMMLEHNIIFRVADHMCDVRRLFSWFKNSPRFRMKRTKCQSVYQNVLAKCYKESLAGTLRQNKFSILIDESTDISTSQNVCIMIRVHGKTTVVSRFWDLVPVLSRA